MISRVPPKPVDQGERPFVLTDRLGRARAAGGGVERPQPDPGRHLAAAGTVPGRVGRRVRGRAAADSRPRDSCRLRTAWSDAGQAEVDGALQVGPTAGPGEVEGQPFGLGRRQLALGQQLLQRGGHPLVEAAQPGRAGGVEQGLLGQRVHEAVPADVVGLGADDAELGGPVDGLVDDVLGQAGRL